jgi:hypothetical protein
VRRDIRKNRSNSITKTFRLWIPSVPTTMMLMMKILRLVHFGISIRIADAWLTPRACTAGLIPTATVTRTTTIATGGRLAGGVLLRLTQRNADEDAPPPDEEEWSDFADMGYTAAAEAEAPTVRNDRPKPSAINRRDPLSSLVDKDNQQQQQQQQQELSSLERRRSTDDDDVVAENNKIDKGDDGDDSWNVQLRQETQQRRQTSRSVDYTAIRSRQFTFGKDLILTNYVGDMGFDEVTDWQYYYQDIDEDGRPAPTRPGGAGGGSADRNVAQPNPFDSTRYVRYYHVSSSLRMWSGRV